MSKTNFVAVYGSLRPGDYNYYGSLEHVGQTKIKGYHLYPVGYGAYPAIIPSDDDSELVVDILAMDDNEKRGIDSMERGAGYDIKNIDIELDGKVYPCHIYVYQERNWDYLKSNPRVESGDWIEYKKSKV